VFECHDLLGLAEIGAACQLAQDENVEALDVLAPERGGLRQRRIADGGTQVGEQVELLPEPQQPGLGTDGVGHLVPLRPAHRAEDDCLGLARLGERLVGERRAVPVDGGAADQRRLGLELGPPLAVEEGHDALHLGHHLRSDAVAGKQQKRVRGHRRFLLERNAKGRGIASLRMGLVQVGCNRRSPIAPMHCSPVQFGFASCTLRPGASDSRQGRRCLGGGRAMWLQGQSLIGLVVLPLLAWALSERRGAVAPARLARILVAGIGLQVAVAGVMLNVPASRAAFDWAASLVAALQAATGTGMRLVFGYLAGGPAPFDVVRPETGFILAFQALPLILVISALSKLLYYWGVLQRVVAAIGWVLQRSLGVSGPVGTSAAANVFVGMVEAPLL